MDIIAKYYRDEIYRELELLLLAIEKQDPGCMGAIKWHAEWIRNRQSKLAKITIDAMEEEKFHTTIAAREA